MSRSTRLGMKTFDQCLFDLYERAYISYDDAIRNADSKNELRLRIKLESKRDARPADDAGSLSAGGRGRGPVVVSDAGVKEPVERRATGDSDEIKVAAGAGRAQDPAAVQADGGAARLGPVLHAPTRRSRSRSKGRSTRSTSRS